MLVAAKKDDKIMVGVSVCDSLIDMTEKDLSLIENLPFWKVNGTSDCYVFADERNFAFELLRYNDHIFKNITDGNSIITTVVPKMKELLGKHSRIINGNEWESQLLIVKGNKMYSIGRYFSVSENDNYACLGFEGYVLGCLEELSNKGYEVSSLDKVVNSLRYLNAIRNRDYFPLITFDTSTKKRRVFYK